MPNAGPWPHVTRARDMRSGGLPLRPSFREEDSGQMVCELRICGRLSGPSVQDRANSPGVGDRQKQQGMATALEGCQSLGPILVSPAVFLLVAGIDLVLST